MQNHAWNTKKNNWNKIRHLKIYYKCLLHVLIFYILILFMFIFFYFMRLFIYLVSILFFF